MMMFARAIDRTVRLDQIALHSGLGAGALWLGVLFNAAPRLAAGGTICGEPTFLLGHCPLCWPAAVLTAVSLAAIIRLRRA
jgi:hypothetical protein